MRYLLCLLLLAGCSTYSETFDCEPGKGVGCVSLSHVNALVDKGKLPLHAKPRLWVREHDEHPAQFLDMEDL